MAGTLHVFHLLIEIEQVKRFLGIPDGREALLLNVANVEARV